MDRDQTCFDFYKCFSCYTVLYGILMRSKNDMSFVNPNGNTLMYADNRIRDNITFILVIYKWLLKLAYLKDLSLKIMKVKIINKKLLKIQAHVD